MDKAWQFMLRNRLTLRDLGVLMALILVVAYVLLQIDVFVEPGEQPRPGTIEYDELPLLGLVICFGLLIVVWRKTVQVRRATRERLEAQRELSELAYVDPLTALPNRRSFADTLGTAVGSPPGADRVHALLLVDLNGFKQINDVYGHGTGDQVLIVVGQRLVSAARDGDRVCRLGGDEFAVVAQHLRGVDAVTSLGMRLIGALEAPIVVGSVEHRVGAGIGACLLPFDGANAEEALRRADVALYRAKAERHAALRFFDQDMDALMRERAAIEKDLPGAVHSGAIGPVFQPLVDLSTHAVVGFEALAAWSHPSLGELRGDRFMPVAEELNLARDIVDELLHTSCQTATTWPDGTFLSFNVTANQFRDDALAPRILDILSRTGLAPDRLEVAIAESALVKYLDAARATLGRLRASGVRIALDDFGTGYSSLYHLRNFKLDKIKIDRSFIERMTSERESEEIVSALIGLGRGFGLTITAEGIEGTSEASALLTRGCQLGQGALYGEPSSAEATLALFHDDAGIGG